MCREAQAKLISFQKFWQSYDHEINKAQGQSPQVYGLNFENPYFSQGQLACQSIRKPSDLF